MQHWGRAPRSVHESVFRAELAALQEPTRDGLLAGTDTCLTVPLLGRWFLPALCGTFDAYRNVARDRRLRSV